MAIALTIEMLKDTQSLLNSQDEENPEGTVSAGWWASSSIGLGGLLVLLLTFPLRKFTNGDLLLPLLASFFLASGSALRLYLLYLKKSMATRGSWCLKLSDMCFAILFAGFFAVFYYCMATHRERSDVFHAGIFIFVFTVLGQLIGTRNGICTSGAKILFGLGFCLRLYGGLGVGAMVAFFIGSIYYFGWFTLQIFEALWSGDRGNLFIPIFRTALVALPLGLSIRGLFRHWKDERRDFRFFLHSVGLGLSILSVIGLFCFVAFLITRWHDGESLDGTLLGVWYGNRFFALRFIRMALFALLPGLLLLLAYRPSGIPNSFWIKRWSLVACVFLAALFGLSGAHPKPRCVVEGGLVATPTGARPIESLVPGDQVLTMDGMNKIQVGVITAIAEHDTLTYLRLVVSDGRVLNVTGEHPVMTGSGWRRAEDIEAGMMICSRQGYFEAKRVTRKWRWVRVYDLSVHPNENFLVQDLLVHNKSGGNEASQVANCKLYAQAQIRYRRTDWNHDGILEYAMAVTGDDSLFESKAGLGDIALVDASFARACGDPLYAPPKSGYLFKVFHGQGPDAEGGAMSYIENGSLTKGFGFIAYPAVWDGTGRNSFIINHQGKVYMRDMGAETEEIVKGLNAYNPDSLWVDAE